MANCPKQITYLDLVFAIQFVIVKRVFGDSCISLVQKLHESNVLFGRDKTHFVEIGISVGSVIE